MTHTNTLSIDIETYSSVDLTKSGVYKYVEAPDFTILLIAYKFNDGPVIVLDLTKIEEVSDEDLITFAVRLSDVNTLKKAHNAAFERTCLAKYFNTDMPSEQWSCTMVHASMLGLPMSLGKVAEVLKLPMQKDTEGKALIRLFCQPNKVKAKKVPEAPKKLVAEYPLIVNEYFEHYGGFTSVEEAVEFSYLYGTEWDNVYQLCCEYEVGKAVSRRIMPEEQPEKWAKFVEYCRQDVVVEDAISKKIAFFEVPQREKDLWCLDQRINDRGVLVDQPFIHNAMAIDAEYKTRLEQEAIALTGLDNPNSLQQLSKWLEEETGDAVTSLTKDNVTSLIDTVESSKAKRLLEIRQQISKTSIKKYAAMLSYVCNDGRIRGLFQFNGANRTGRWAGRGVQVQNLTKNDDRLDVNIFRGLVSEGDGLMLELLYKSVPDMLSQLIRTSFVAPEGKRFIVCDASAIEARIIAWLSGEQWRLDVFNGDGKIYEASAAQMFKVPIESIDKKHPLRQKGKIAELALGYGGGKGALETMGALKMGLDKKELQPLVKAWRQANPAVVALWKNLENAAIRAVETGSPQTVEPGITFYTKASVLFARLPSGRCLSYMRPSLTLIQVCFVEYLEDGPDYEKGQKAVQTVAKANLLSRKKVVRISGEPFDRKELSYEGMNQTTKQWQREKTYGGKLSENMCQAIARDCLAECMLRIASKGYDITLHVHDEVVPEVADGFGSLAEIEEIMSEPISWAPGLPLGAEGFESKFYKK